ncbi:MAG: 6-bladed beta-propeller [Candidatus Aminicenantes bacterium]|nr:6-bladed beta-propeller [Candidatus Aminicenantes bacterium]
MRGIVFGFLYFLFFNSVIFTQEIIENTEKPLSKNASRVLRLKEVMRIKDEPGKFYFRAPHDIKIAKNGSIFINDYRGNNFLNISHDGKFFKNLYKKGEGPGEIRDYFKYALSQNEIYIYDFIKRKIICIEQEGSLINEFKTYTEKYNRFKGIFGDWLVLMKKVLPAKRDKVQMYQDKNTIVLLSKDGKKNKESHVFLNKTFYIANRGIVPWDPFVSVLAENSGCLYVSCSREYMIHMLDLNRGKVMRSFKRKYKRVRYEMSQDEDKFMKRVNAPRKKYERDINRLHLFNGLLWVETSTKDEKKGIMIDVFNNKGQFLDNFYLALDGDLISVQDNFIFVKELDEEGNIVVKKYIIEEEN